MVIPTPEPQNYVDAQLAAVLDPTSSRDTLLITPGTPMPSVIPQGVTVARTKRGLVLTTNPAKISVIDNGTEEQVGQAIFGYGYDQSQGGNMAAVATNQQGTPVAEIAAPSNGSGMMQAMQAAGLLAPAGGAVNLKPRKDAAMQRMVGLLGD